MKATNFAPHGNFGRILERSVASLDEFSTKNEQNKVCKLKIFLQLLFPPFFCRTRFDDSNPFWKKRSKVSMRSKVRGFDGNIAIDY